jgi:FtsP/CotA-like multicopper oxidase with cupredoxin domain
MALGTVTTNFVNIYLSALAWKSLLPRSSQQLALWVTGLTGAAFSLLRLAVQSPGPTAAPLPAQLVPLQRLDPGHAEVRRRFVMDMRMPPFAGAFTINGRSFDASRVDVRVERGVVEAWEVVNASSEPHPFHVHATQFQVVSRSSGPLGPHELGLKDTVLVWPGETLSWRPLRALRRSRLHCQTSNTRTQV